MVEGKRGEERRGEERDMISRENCGRRHAVGGRK
jgi:hypothetical protein